MAGGTTRIGPMDLYDTQRKGAIEAACQRAFDLLPRRRSAGEEAVIRRWFSPLSKAEIGRGTRPIEEVLAELRRAAGWAPVEKR